MAAVLLFCTPTSQGSCTSADPNFRKGRSKSWGRDSSSGHERTFAANDGQSLVQKSRMRAAINALPSGLAGVTVHPTMFEILADRSDQVSG